MPIGKQHPNQANHMYDCELFSQNVYNVPQGQWPRIILCKSRITPKPCGIRIGSVDHVMEILVLHDHCYVAELTLENAISGVSQFFIQMKSGESDKGDAVEELNTDESPALSAFSFAFRATGYEKWTPFQGAGCINFFANI